MQDLGPVLSTHKGRIAAGGYLWYMAPLVFLFGAWALVSAPFTGDWGRAGSGVLGMGLALVLLIWPVMKLRQTLTAYQNGFVWERLFRAPLTVRWADVRNVRITEEHDRRAIHAKGVHLEIEITLADRSVVVISNDLDDIDAIQGYLRSAASAPRAAVAGAPPPAAPPSPWG